MAKIYIKGNNEPILVTNEDADIVSRACNDKDQFVTVGGKTIRTSEIKLISKEDVSLSNGDEQNKEQVRNYYRKRDELLRLPPKERAKVSAWGHFSLFFKGMHGRLPNEETKETIQKWATEFYTQNPEWSKPSVKFWAEKLKLEKDYKVDGITLRLLERCEANEFEDIKKNREFGKKVAMGMV